MSRGIAGRVQAVARDRQARADDSGAYAILFALLIVVLLGISALALDLALVRESRALTRAAADNAAVAATSFLKEGLVSQSNPRQACITASDYLRASISEVPDGTSTCTSTYQTTYATCPSTPIVATWSGNGYRVRITWPVLNSSSLMTSPDTAPAFPSQAGNATVDGTDPCARMGVELFRDNTLAFGGILGIGETTTRASSVARSIVSGEVSSRIAALNILDTTACNSLSTTGGGTVNVGTVTNPGNISVDSDGSTSCGGQARVISPANATNNGIFVIGTGGQITSFAMAGANAAKAYDPALVPLRLDPAPVSQSARVTRSPVDAFFNCTANCQTGGGNYIQNNVRTPLITNLSAATAAGLGFVSVSSCNINGATVISAAKVYFNCNSLDIKAPLFLTQATTVVTKGGIAISSGGCMVVNAPAYRTATTATACPTTVAQIDSGTVTSDAIVALQSGDFTQSGTSQLALRNTMTYLHGGYTDFSGSGLLYLTSPEGLGCAATDLSCRYGKFWKLTLWSEFTTSNKPFKYRGQSALKMRGVLFTPNGDSDLAGGSGTQQNRAQFWTKTLVVSGGAAVNMDVDPDAAIAQPAFGGTLIR